MDSAASDRKRALRAELRERRRNRTDRERREAETGLTRELIDLVTDLSVRTLSAYLSSRDEPNVRPFLNWAHENGIQTLLPITRDDGLLDWTTADDATESESATGWPEAVGELLGPIAINDVDLILAPAAAVDLTGTRMGWGRGYFDKTLGSMEKCPPVYAVVFDNEILDLVPRERHDQPVDGAVTPTRVLSFT